MLLIFYIYIVLHGDIKSENILINASLKVKLIDVDGARYLPKSGIFNDFYTMMSYAAPEIIRGRCHDGLVIDIWSVGVVLYYLLMGEIPFDNNEEILNNHLSYSWIRKRGYSNCKCWGSALVCSH